MFFYRWKTHGFVINDVDPSKPPKYYGCVVILRENERWSLLLN